MDFQPSAAFLLWIEIAIVISSILYVLLIAVEKKAGWWFGVCASLLGIYFFIQINLFAEAFLAVYYVLVGMYGYFHWKYGGAGGHKPPIETRRLRFHFLVCSVALLISVIVAQGLIAIGSDYPYIDAATTVFSLFTTWMAARKLLENWIYWIGIDAVYVWLYAVKGAPIYSGLMVFYTILAFVGFLIWLRNFRKHTDEIIKGNEVVRTTPS